MSPLMAGVVAVKALRRNAMRTSLTALGMIIGVAAVITMVALGTGAQSSIESQIQSAGTNMIMVSAGKNAKGNTFRARKLVHSGVTRAASQGQARSPRPISGRHVWRRVQRPPAPAI